MTKTILLAEDHDANRAVIKRRLERRGYVVVEATDGAAAVALSQTSSPDCVLMDLSMPVMSGMEALQRIRADAATAAIPAIALTAHAQEAMREKCFDIGFNAFLTKPIDFEELSRCLTTLTS